MCQATWQKKKHNKSNQSRTKLNLTMKRREGYVCIEITFHLQENKLIHSLQARANMASFQRVYADIRHA